LNSSAAGFFARAFTRFTFFTSSRRLMVFAASTHRSSVRGDATVTISRALV